MTEHSQIRLTKYAQIQAAIREQFFSGTLQVGDRLPSERQMARTLGTSPLTVSRVLDDYVREGILSREPRRGTFLRSIPYDKTRRVSIGVLLLTPQYPETQETAVAILQFARERSVLATLMAPGESPGLLAECAGELCRQGCRGILAGAVPEAALMTGLRRVIPASIPLVGFRSNPSWLGPQVVVSEEKGGYAGTRYLIEQGHRQILMLSGQNPFEARACGYRRALSEAGLGVYEHFVRPTNGTLAGGFEAMSSALVGPRQYTAVFCHNDFVALGAIEAIRRAGLRVPQELSVMGFDELAPSGSRGMGLSTVAMRKIELAQQALALLLECIDRPPERKEPGILELEPRVIVGETTASLSRNGSLISP